MGPCYHIVDLITQFLTQHFARLSLSFSCKKYKLLLSSLLFFCTDFLLSSLYHTSMNLSCFIFPAYFSLKEKHNCFDGSDLSCPTTSQKYCGPKEIFLLRSCDGPRPCAYKIDHWTKDWTHIYMSLICTKHARIRTAHWLCRHCRDCKVVDWCYCSQRKQKCPENDGVWGAQIFE